MLSAGRPVAGGVIATSDFQVSSAHLTSVARSTPAGSAAEVRAPKRRGQGLGAAVPSRAAPRAAARPVMTVRRVMVGREECS